MTTYKIALFALALASSACDRNAETADEGKTETERTAKQKASARETKPESNEAPEARLAAGGLWVGRFQSPGFTGEVMGLVTEQGDARFVSSSGVQSVGKLAVQGDDVTGKLTSFVNNRAAGEILLQAKVSPGATLAGTYQSAGQSGRFDMKYSREYERRIASEDLADRWGSSGFAMTVDEGGRFEGKDALGCSYRGNLAQVDERFNAFALAFDVSGCAYGGSYTGLAAVTRDGSELMAYGASGATYGVAGFLGRGKSLGASVAWRGSREAVRDANEAVRDANEAVGKANEAVDKANELLRSVR